MLPRFDSFKKIWLHLALVLEIAKLETTSCIHEGLVKLGARTHHDRRFPLCHYFPESIPVIVFREFHHLLAISSENTERKSMGYDPATF